MLKIPQEYCSDAENEPAAWFIENTLTSINTTLIRFIDKKEKFISSNIFTMSDKAYPTLIIKNEFDWWKDMKWIKEMRNRLLEVA